jgi:hypothetical protein
MVPTGILCLVTQVRISFSNAALSCTVRGPHADCFSSGGWVDQKSVAVSCRC